MYFIFLYIVIELKTLLKKINIMINVTYNELVSLINLNQLTPETQYKITDFKTTHYILNYNGNRLTGNPTNVGKLEPLILTADSTNTFLPEVKSEKYPKDIILYDWNPQNWLNDAAFCLDGINIVPNFKGAIYTRHDTFNHNIMSEDFRNTKNRRWKKNIQFWSNDTIYNLKDEVQVTGSTGGIYFSKIKNNTNNFVTDTNSWEQIITYKVSEYWEVDTNNTNDINDFIDVHTFYEMYGSNTIYEKCVKNNKFSLVKDNLDIFSGYTGSILNNNVFYIGIEDNQYSVMNNEFDNYFNCNTIHGYTFNNNKIGKLFNTNIIGHIFYQNKIKDEFYNNIIGRNFSSNIIGNSFKSNNIGNYFYQNEIGNRFHHNNIGNLFYQNEIGNNFYQNIVNDLLNTNIIGNDFYNNEIETTFNSNTIGNFFHHNKIEEYFYQNTIKDQFYQNIIKLYFNSNYIENDFNNNTINKSFNSNKIGNSFKFNDIGDNYYYNNIGNSFKFNNIGQWFYDNIIGDYFSDNIIGNKIIFLTIPTGTTFRLNTIKDNINFTYIDFNLLTHVYQNYTTTIEKNGENITLTYVDVPGNNTQTVVVNS